ncbi:MAG: ElaA protein [Arenicella sp.]|jgi:ElaA protein
MKISWQTHSFENLKTAELFELLMLRQTVFIVEQQCPYPDIDELDFVAMHFCGRNDHGQLIAYARLLKPGLSYQQASIGRVVVSPSARGLKLGRRLMQAALLEMEKLYPEQAIKIGAQQHLEPFYNQLGFETISAMYLEDDIPHIHMLRS